MRRLKHRLWWPMTGLHPIRHPRLGGKQRGQGWHLKSPQIGAKQDHRWQMAHASRHFLSLLFLIGFELFGQITLSITVHLWLVPVLAKDPGNVLFVELVMRDYSPRANRRQQRSNKEDIDQHISHDPTKVKPIGEGSSTYTVYF